MAIKVTEALRLSIVKVSQLIGIGGLYWGNNKICNWGQQSKGSHLENFDGEQNNVVTCMTWWKWSHICIQRQTRTSLELHLRWLYLWHIVWQVGRKYVYKLSFGEIGFMVCCIRNQDPIYGHLQGCKNNKWMIAWDSISLVNTPITIFFLFCSDLSTLEFLA